jgi:thiamine monophosphate kinase
MKIGIDFDGVIVERNEIPRETDFFLCRPTENALKAIKWLREKHEVYVCTSRREVDKIKRWLNQYGFPPLRITNWKEEGTHIYLDDRAVRFTTWLDFCKLMG